MVMPKAISTWFMILFFLFAGLALLVPAMAGGIFSILTGLFALGAAVFLFLGR
jgi:hypothetical protein